MANLYVVNRTTSDLILEGDNGMPRFKVPHTPGANYYAVQVDDFLGNELLCDSVAALITSSDAYLRWGSTTGTIIPAASLETYKNGNTFDVNEDGVVDSAAATVSSNRTTVVFADSPKTLTTIMDVIECNTTGGVITLNLPTAVGNTGLTYRVIDVAGTAGTSAITIDGSGSQTINGALTATINTAYGMTELYSNGANWIANTTSISNYPVYQYVGTITNAASFPLIANVKKGWAYYVSAAVVDNAGATYTNTSQVFTTGDTIVWNGTGWNILASQNAYNHRGNIAVATDFPLIANVKAGHTYRCTAGVTDNGGATYTNTGSVFLLGDTILWLGSAWYVISQGAATAAPLAIGTASAGTSTIKSNQDHVHAHGDQLGGTLHADVIAGGADGFMTGTQATTLIRVNDHTMAVKLAGLNCMVDETEVSAQLTGDVGKKFNPTHIVVTVATVTGTPATPAALNVGTAADGAQILSNSALTGLILVGDTRMIPLTAGTFNIAGNATLYANVESAEATATVMTVDVWVHGILTTPT